MKKLTARLAALFVALMCVFAPVVTAPILGGGFTILRQPPYDGGGSGG